MFKKQKINNNREDLKELMVTHVIDLGEEFKDVAIKVNGRTLNISEGGITTLSHGNGFVEISGEGDNITVHGQNITVFYQDTVQAKPLEKFRPAKNKDYSKALIGKEIGYDTSSILGGLPCHYSGWTIYNITEEGIIQALEPKDHEKDTVENTQEGALKHIEKLKAEGHETARLWTKADASAIFNNIVSKNLSNKAGLNVSPDAEYWEMYVNPENDNLSSVRCLYNNKSRWCFRTGPNKEIIVRGVQDIPDIKLK